MNSSKATRMITTAAWLCTAALAGCAGPTTEQSIGVWLDEKPRTLALEVNPNLPTPTVLVDHTMADRVGNGVVFGAGAAAVAIGGGCMMLGPVGCAMGAVASPFMAAGGAITGAVRTPSNVQYHPLSKAKGGVELTQAAIVPAEVVARLEEAVLSSAKNGRHALRRAVAGEGKADGSILVSIDGIYLESRSDPHDDDAEVVLAIRADATIGAPVAEARKIVTVEGSQRLPISAWRKDGEKLFREELRKVIDDLGAGIIEAINASPGMTARAMVAIERQEEERRARAGAVSPAESPAPDLVAEPRRPAP